jgi:DNA replication licensing factor MCM4
MCCGVQVAMQQSALDPATGTIDMDLIQTGISAGDRMQRMDLARELQTLVSGVPLLQLFDEF